MADKDIRAFAFLLSGVMGEPKTRALGEGVYKHEWTPCFSVEGAERQLQECTVGSLGWIAAAYSLRRHHHGHEETDAESAEWVWSQAERQ